MMEERRILTLHSPHEVGMGWLTRSRFRDGARREETQHAAGWCLSSEADSHPPKAPIGRQESKAGLSQAKGTQAAAPADRRKMGLRVAGG